MKKPKVIERITHRPHNPQGDEAAQLLRDYHQLGAELLELYPEDDRQPGCIPEITRKWGLSQHTVYKAMAFAKTYTEKDLESLCSQRDRDGNPLSWSQLIQLLSFKRRVRRSLVKLTLKNGWSSRQLMDEIKVRHNRKSGTHGGRPFAHQRKTTSSTEAVANFLALMASARKSLDVAVNLHDSTYTVGIFSRLSEENSDISEDQFESLDDNLRKITQLAGRARRRLKQLRDNGRAK